LAFPAGGGDSSRHERAGRFVNADRVLLGIVLASAVGLVTWRGRMLSVVGAAVATLLGAVAVSAGDRWGLILLAFFVPAAALSTWRRQAKARLAGSVIDSAPTRTAAQVIANGGIFGLATVLALLAPDARWDLVALGALSAAAADTWATEVGIGSGATPWSVRTLGPVAHGTSGAVSLPGTLAMIAGGAWMGTAAWGAGFDPTVAIAGSLGGVAGAIGDTLLGAAIQHDRWCATCDRPTERNVHDCGNPTVGHGGWRFMTNDMVNFVSTVTGAATAILIHRGVS
jgi:uncharacterized protein (TIGR00297 family)